MPVTVSALRRAYSQAMDRGVAFVLAHQNQDGSFNPLESGLAVYYKIPFALTGRGEVQAAVRHLQWVKANGFTPEGNFDGRYGRCFPNESYPNAWMIWGAHKLGMYDVSLPAMPFLLGLQDPETGGFYRTRPDAKGAGDDGPVGAYTGGNIPGIQDLTCTSMSGMACLATGHVEEARRAGGFVQRMLALQPAPHERIYFRWLNGVGVVTEFPEDLAIAFMIDGKRTGQMYFNVGIAAAFLAKLYQATGVGAYLETAKAYLDTTEGFASDRYATIRAGKVGWGAAYVYRLTGEERYRKMSLAVGEGLCEFQGPSGSWVESDSLASRVEVTAEFIALLNEMQDALS